jgi:hypothetical protein
MGIILKPIDEVNLYIILIKFIINRTFIFFI